jgi:predicted transcriptional regulator
MTRRLEIPSTLTAQQAVLLERLTGWSESQLEKKLKSLEAKGIVTFINNSSIDRRIYLERLSEIPDLDDKEKQLWLRLRTFVSHDAISVF